MAGGAWTNPRIAMQNNMRRSSFLSNTFTNGFEIAISYPFEGNSTHKHPAALDLLGLQAWTVKGFLARSCDGSGEVQEALLCDNTDLLRQCRYVLKKAMGRCAF